MPTAKRMPGDRRAHEGIARYADGGSEEALTMLQEAVELGVSNPDAYEVLLSLAKGTDHEEAAQVAAGQFLQQSQVEILPVDRARLWTDLLESADPGMIGEQGFSVILLSALHAAAVAGEPGWTRLDQPSLRGLIMARIVLSFAGLEIAEQLLYAPVTTGWPATALQRIEAIGSSAQGDTELARAAERLLHDFGEPEAAYRVERIRRSWKQERKRRPVREGSRKRRPLHGVTVAIGGGHPGLRANVGRQVDQLGGAVREIPSRFEAVRRDKDVVDILRGADIAVVIIPQIAHSTSDQIKRAAAKLSVPVISAPSASAPSIVALIMQWYDETRAR
ncbi:hypothetical protein BH24CHL4_BH24CHL4_12320 [soil metagenome]